MEICQLSVVIISQLRTKHTVGPFYTQQYTLHTPSLPQTDKRHPEATTKTPPHTFLAFSRRREGLEIL
jgi:hypothetical protein